jgi:hypothetical protein
MPSSAMEFFCEKCEKAFRSRSGLRQHKKRSVCGKTFCELCRFYVVTRYLSHHLCSGEHGDNAIRAFNRIAEKCENSEGLFNNTLIKFIIPDSGKPSNIETEDYVHISRIDCLDYCGFSSLNGKLMILNIVKK